MLSIDEKAVLSGRFESTIVVPLSAVSPHLLEERSRREIDRWDEMWEGVLHIVPQPKLRHQIIGTRLSAVLLGLADARGLQAVYEPGFERRPDDYRVPDLAVYGPEHAVDDTLRGAELVVEVVSPGDKSWAKLPWYAARGVREVVLLDRDTLAVDFFVSRGGDLVPVEVARSEVLGCTFERVDGDHLRVEMPEGPPADIRL